jgi:hypothetical protein
MSDEAAAEMPKYRSHKTVHALKIASIDHVRDDGSARIVPADQGYAPFDVEAAYMHNHSPKVGGYYVVYDDGYKSWSPAAAFESGYTRI